MALASTSRVNHGKEEISQRGKKKGGKGITVTSASTSSGKIFLKILFSMANQRIRWCHVYFTFLHFLKEAGLPRRRRVC